MSVVSRASVFRVLVALVGVVLLTAYACVPRPAWQRAAVQPPPPRPVPFRPADISCVAPGACVVVGQPAERDVVRHDGHALVGDGRSFQPVAVPTNAELNIVSCATATWCLAGGDARGSTGPVRRFVQRDGDRWTLVANAHNRVSALACARERWCLGVGRSEGSLDPRSGRPFAAVFDGERFTEVSPADAPEGRPLSNVACSGPAWCLAVGPGGGGIHGYVWDGTELTDEALPALPGGAAQDTYILAAECAAEGRCLVAGLRGGAAFALARTGDGWVGIDPPATPDWQVQHVDVACGAPTSCLLVGEEYQTLTGEYRPVARSWDGVRWSDAGAGLPPDRNLWSVSCSGPSACTAVGLERTPDNNGRVPGPALHHWNGTSWTTARAAVAMRPAELSKVACTSASVCLAVGEGVLRLDRSSSTWKALPSTDPTSAPGLHLQDISCATPTFCVAIGSPSLPGTTLPDRSARARLFRWTGAVFVPMARPAHPTAVLTDISCAPDGSCLALAFQPDSEAGRSAAYTWNGLVWAEVAHPPLLQARDVSCTARNACVAVGTIRGSAAVAALGGAPGGAPAPGPDHAAAFAWNGSQWQDLAVPRLAGATDTVFTSVSCPTGTWCAAAGSAAEIVRPPGSAGGSGPHDPLTATWDGTTWTLTRAPITPGSTQTLHRYEDVSCASPARCAAVGATGRTGERWILEEPISALWNGTAWSSLPMLAAGAEMVASGVSCRENACWAVGDSLVIGHHVR